MKVKIPGIWGVSSGFDPLMNREEALDQLLAPFFQDRGTTLQAVENSEGIRFFLNQITLYVDRPKIAEGDYCVIERELEVRSSSICIKTGVFKKVGKATERMMGYQIIVLIMGGENRDIKLKAIPKSLKKLLS